MTKEKLKRILRNDFHMNRKSKILADIFVECLYSNKPLSLKELCEKTRYSESSISLALKIKEPYFRIFSRPGSNKKYVELNSQFKELFFEDLIQINKKIIPEILDALKDEKKNQNIKRFEKQMHIVKKITDKVINEFENEFKR